MWRSICNFLQQAAGDTRRWHPLVAVYYLTYACDYRCPYCGDGSRKPYWTLNSPDLPAAAVLRLLALVRRYCDFLVITGGEPLKHPAVDDVLFGLPDVDFDGVIFTTNGDGMEVHLPMIAPAVTHLGISIDTLDHEKADRWHGDGAGSLARILAGLERAASYPGRRYDIVISSVATPDNLEDLPAVYDFAKAHGFRYSLAPELQGVTMNPALAGNAAYRKMFDLLIEEKRRGADIQGSPLYLAYMRDQKQFSCRPSAVLALAPNGDVFYPCLEIGNVAGNLLRTADLTLIRKEAIGRFGAEPHCGNQCQSPCALGLSLAFSNPSSVVEEALLAIKATTMRHLGVVS